MKLIKLFFYLILFGHWSLVIGHFSPVLALYDPRTVPNNSVGVHILSPDEVGDAAKLVNDQGGDWGYVTIPIQPSERDLDKWQSFFDRCRELHLIPIVRITTIPQGGTWAQGENTDLVDFANFLNVLHWPIANRYIVLFNEVNRSTEWGGEVDPAKYSDIVQNAYTIFKERNPDFFLLGPALDLALPNSATSLSASKYLLAMKSHNPLVFSYFDGWASHSYPNPGFTSTPTKTGLTSIVGYKSEFSLLKLAPKPVFITETGWDQDQLAANLINSYWSKAWGTWQRDPNVVAVTPFILRGGDAFSPFSLLDSDGNLRPSGVALRDLTKDAGSPILAPAPTPTPTGVNPSTSGYPGSLFQANRALFKLENIFRVVLGLPAKAHLTLSDQSLTVELAQNTSQWEKGLSHRTALADKTGMLFIFPEAHVPLFWMKNMRFPIDIIWLADQTVVDITHSAPVDQSDRPPTYSPRIPVNMVLEVPAGWSESHGIKLGDSIKILDQ